MYFTSLPDHQKPGFDEELHFSRFKQHNIIFNALASKTYCERLEGSFSIKTILSGEEWYEVNNRQLAVRPGQFLILNDGQDYSCRVETAGEVRIQSVFFTKAFASSVFHDALATEESLLDNPVGEGQTLEFFQTLYETDSGLEQKLTNLIAALNTNGYDSNRVDEHLIFLLHHLISFHKKEVKKCGNVRALKPATRNEIYKRLCVAKDFLHSAFMDKHHLSRISSEACLSTPQLVRQFQAAFGITPHQYLIQIRLGHAARLLKQSSMSVQEITWRCGFENPSAFCRAFKTASGISPLGFRIERL